MTAKVVSKNSLTSFCFNVKNNLNIRSCNEARLQTCEHFLLLNKFLRLGLNENLLLNFLSHFFHLVPCILEF